MQSSLVVLLILFCSSFCCCAARRLSRILPQAEGESGVPVFGDCGFSVNGDLSDPAPLFSRHQSYELIVPDSTDTVRLANGELLDLFCPGDGFTAPFAKQTQITVQCLQQKYFLHDGLIYALSNFTCANWPTYTAQRTGRECNGGTDLVQVGFEMEDGAFLHAYDVCHDELAETTRYVHHVLHPCDYQHGVSRPNFAQLDFYGDKDVNIKYTQTQQNFTISEILGLDASPYFNYSDDRILARGHMAAKADMIFAAWQHATFLFINVAPQWQTFNGGNWERIESSVRKFVATENITVDCYTGTWGVSRLPDFEGTPRELYLDFDENNNGLIPVPMLYFRVIIARETREGIVLIGVNNPYASLADIQKEYILCEDIGHQLSWVGWMKEDLHEGYSYACTVEDFTAVVKDLPLEDLHTNGVLGLDEPVFGDCGFSVNGDLSDPAPLFSRHQSYELIVPDSTDTVRLANGELLDLFCPGDGFTAPFAKQTQITVQCLQQKYFLHDGLIYALSNFTCANWPTYTAQRTGRECNGGTDLVQVGFEMEDGAFLHAYDVCHDELAETTRYVHHVLHPCDYQHGVSRPNFAQLDFYGDKDVNIKYTQTQQNFTISEILGLDASPYFNYSDDRILARGHMAAKADMIFAAWQHATFLFINVAPQWQTFNGGNWERIESSVRKFVATENITVDCYTGTWGVSRLPDFEGTPRELYLDFDENNNGLIPVPMLYFRVIIARETREGIVLIGVNNPYASLADIQKEYILCEDIGHQLSWVGWMKEDLHEGYSYACTVEDFTAVVKDLPLEDLHTNGVLGLDEPICGFSVNGDLSDPAPLFSRHQSYELIVPDSTDTVRLANGELLDLFCPGDGFTAPFAKQTQITVQCLQQKYFLHDGLIYALSNFTCANWPTYTAQRTGRECNGGTDLVQVGFEMEDGAFLHAYDVCHDELAETTRYVHHVLHPCDYQHGVSRPNFAQLDFYGDKDVNIKYTQTQQNFTISEILGLDASPYFNYSDDRILARGHMAAKADMIFAAWQHATFLFINVAPQWQTFNGGNWERIESSVRKFVATENITVDCYTGTWGVSRLPDFEGTPRELYLDFDENNNGLIPVPMLYFRVIIARETREGIVLIGVNNPYASLADIQKEYILCEDIGHQLSWVGWMKEDLHEGYSYACTVEDFTAVVKDLPLEDLHTNGVLGLDEPI
ncbi:CG14120, partial [Drosophila busckii]